MKANILVYVSSAKTVPYKEGGSHAVGVFLGELTEPLEQRCGNEAVKHPNIEQCGGR